MIYYKVFVKIYIHDWRLIEHKFYEHANTRQTIDTP